MIASPNAQNTRLWVTIARGDSRCGGSHKFDWHAAESIASTGSVSVFPKAISYQ